MQLKILLLLTTSLVTAFPGTYNSNYGFQHQSASFLNSELQRKHEEAGTYSAQGETDSIKPPVIQATYKHQDYQKPQDPNVESDKPKVDSYKPAIGLSGHQRSYTNYGASLPSSGNLQRRVYVPRTSTSAKLEELDDGQTTDYSRFTAHGFGRDYLENTEGQTPKPTEKPLINVQYHYGRPGSQSIQVPFAPVKPVNPIQVGDFSRNPQLDNTNHKYVDDDLTQQSQVNFGQIEFGSNHQQKFVDEKDLTQLSQMASGKIDFESHGHSKGFQHGNPYESSDMTQQSQVGFGKVDIANQNNGKYFHGKHEDLTQQAQVGFGQLEISSQHQGKVANHEDMIQQSQLGFGKLDFDSQHQEKHQPQIGFDKLETSSQNNGKPTQQHFPGYGRLHIVGPQHPEDTDMTQQSEVGFGALEFGSQHQGKHFEQDMSQQSQVGFGKLDLSSQNHGKPYELDDMTQQSQVGFGKFDIGNQYHGGHAEHEDMTQQSQIGFGKLEIGSQNHGLHHEDQEDLTQQSQVSFGKLDLGSQNHGKIYADQEDMTHQSQVGFGKLEIGSQNHGKHYHNQEDMSQQSQGGFGKLEIGNQNHGKHYADQEDLTQQSQVGFGKLDLGRQIHGKRFELEDMTQQSQVGFGKLEMGNQNHAKHYADQEDLTQQSQVGFGKPEIGSQYGKYYEDGLSYSQSEKHFQEQINTAQNSQKKLNESFSNLEVGPLHILSQKETTDDKIRDQHRGYLSSHQQYGSTYGGARAYSEEDTHILNQGRNYHSAIKPVYEENPEETDKAIEDIAQYAQKVQDVSLQAQTPKPHRTIMIVEESLHPQKKQISEEHAQEEIITETITTTKKPGFWRRVGSSITSTYETAKEKTINLAEKVKHNLG